MCNLYLELGVRAPGQTAGGGGSNFTPYIIEIQAGEVYSSQVYIYNILTPFIQTKKKRKKEKGRRMVVAN